jgi:hypothetical protein
MRSGGYGGRLDERDNFQRVALELSVLGSELPDLLNEQLDAIEKAPSGVDQRGRALRCLVLSATRGHWKPRCDVVGGSPLRRGSIPARGPIPRL